MEAHAEAVGGGPGLTDNVTAAVSESQFGSAGKGLTGGHEVAQLAVEAAPLKPQGCIARGNGGHAGEDRVGAGGVAGLQGAGVYIVLQP